MAGRGQRTGGPQLVVPLPLNLPVMHGYSDRINHAFAFAAKYYNVLAPAGAGMDYLAHPANVAVILARYGCEQVTIVAGILHHVLEESPPDRWPVLERKIGEKFGPVALAVAKDAIEPKYDRRGSERRLAAVQAGVPDPARHRGAARAGHHRGRRAARLRLDHDRAPPAGRGVSPHGIARGLGADHLVVPIAAGDPGGALRLAEAGNAAGIAADERRHGAQPATQ